MGWAFWQEPWSWVISSVTVHCCRATAACGGLTGLSDCELGSLAASSHGARTGAHGLMLEHHQMPPEWSRLAPGIRFLFPPCHPVAAFVADG